MSNRTAIKRNAVLDFIRSKGTVGARFSEIQKFIVEMNGYNYNEMRLENVWDPKSNLVKKRMRRRWRGYWCDYLSGSQYYNTPGILPGFCVKIPNRRWVLRDGV